MEMSPRPEDALRVGDWLLDLVPDAGHLRHMPTHLDVLCGDYRRVVSANTAAIAADEKFRDRAGAMNFYTLYRVHNYHFKIYGAMFLGQAQTALATADQLVAAIPDDLLRVQVPPMADWLEGFVPMKMHVLIRFGRWPDIIDTLIDTPLPADPELYCVSTAMIRYAQGVACAASGRVGEAAEHRAQFEGAVERVPETRTVFNNTCRSASSGSSSRSPPRTRTCRSGHPATAGPPPRLRNDRLATAVPIECRGRGSDEFRTRWHSAPGRAVEPVREHGRAGR